MRLSFFSFMPLILWGPGLKLAEMSKGLWVFPIGDSSATLGIASVATGISVAAVSILAGGMIAAGSHEVWYQQTQNCATVNQ